MSTALKSEQTGLTLNELNTLNRGWHSYDTSSVDSIVIQVFSPPGTSWVSGITVDVEMSHDGFSWTAFTSPQTYSSDGIKPKLDVEDINRVRARISKTSTDGSIRLIVFGSGNG